MDIGKIISLTVVLCLFGAGWSHLDRGNERGLELWKGRAVLLALAVGFLAITLGIYHPHVSAAQRVEQEEAPPGEP